PPPLHSFPTRRSSDLATLAANHILLQFISMSAYFLDGFANVTEMIVGQAYGAKKRQRFVRAVIDNTVVAAVSALMLSLILMLFRSEEHTSELQSRFAL